MSHFLNGNDSRPKTVRASNDSIAFGARTLSMGKPFLRAGF